MDPDATLNELIEAAVNGDTAMLRDAADDLVLWLKRGGFTPADPRAGKLEEDLTRWLDARRART